MKMLISLITKELLPKLIIPLGFLIISSHFAAEIAADEKFLSDELDRSFDYAAFREENDGYSYNESESYGPSQWYKLSSACGKYSQSPINIESDSVIAGTAPMMQINYFTKKVRAVKVTNTGYSVNFELTFSDKSTTNRLYWNGMSSKGKVYVLDSLHFHWGNYCTGGSEHTFNGHRFAAEVHLVHYNEKYKYFASAAQQTDGLAVIAVLFEITEEENNDGSNNNKFTKFLNKVQRKGESYLIDDVNGIFTIKELVKYNFTNYYSYKGSLTTPPCYESVRWIVSKNTVKIYPSELEQFQKLLRADGQPIRHNYRPLQQINGRNIYEYNFAQSSGCNLKELSFKHEN